MGCASRDGRRRDEEMLSPPLARTWRFVKGIGTAAAEAGGRAKSRELGRSGLQEVAGLLKKSNFLAAEVGRPWKETWHWGPDSEAR